ncbi:indole-3-glycerol phosphate synthase TrpC [Arthrobacter zhaoguopingii]|uniref:indole-3-glycerol phosphate synthase TrpC n=1 Tax=Arthrobacter zhaoguopingii TaxID=2681491 RepID=UPI001357775B|nr:indole-3-glycerol phosphate synthase TrpC [Arthrobacter zhaoguopingii]
MSVLDDIISGVREDLSARTAEAPLAQVRARALDRAPAADALGALRGDGRTLSVIAEVKRSSPSKGALAAIADPAALAARYEAGGAAVVSVLTEQRRFHGSLADLDAVRASVRIPVLRKDFTVEDYQIWEARAHGADLVLLIVAALSDAQLEHFLGLTHELGMNALVETHTADEVERATAVRSRIIGVNVRNLKTLDIDRSVFADLARRIPQDAVTVAESGVRGIGDVEEFAAQGARAVLVGEALVRGEDPEAAVAQFRAVPVRDLPGLQQR